VSQPLALPSPPPPLLPTSSFAASAGSTCSRRAWGVPLPPARPQRHGVGPASAGAPPPAQLLDVEAFDPDVVVTIDSKGFNFRLVRLLWSRRARRERRQRWHSGVGVVGAGRAAAPATAAAASAAAATATAATAETEAAAAAATATDTCPCSAPRFLHYVAPSAWEFADGKKRLRASMGQGGVGGRGCWIMSCC
jgi:hypothetical protein